MNDNRRERKTRAVLQFLAWAQEFSPEWHAKIMEQAPAIPPAGALNQLGAAWDMFYPSNYYSGTGYRGRWHSAAEHLSGLGQDVDPWGGIGVSTSTTTTTNGFDWEGVLNKVISVGETAIEALPAVFQARQTIAIADVNLERAKQGLPPLDPEATAAQINVTHTLPPDVQQQISAFKMGGVNILLWGGIALAGFFVVRALR